MSCFDSQPFTKMAHEVRLRGRITIAKRISISRSHTTNFALLALLAVTLALTVVVALADDASNTKAALAAASTSLAEAGIERLSMAA